MLLIGQLIQDKTDIILLLSSITEEKAKELYVEEKQQIKTPLINGGVFFVYWPKQKGFNENPILK